MFDRKLKIVEIFSAEVGGREKCGSGPLFFLRRLPFFLSLSPSVNLLVLFPEMQSSYRRIVVKGIGNSINLLGIFLKGRLWDNKKSRDYHYLRSLSLSILQDSTYIDKRIGNQRSLSHFASSKHGSSNLGLQ